MRVTAEAFSCTIKAVTVATAYVEDVMLVDRCLTGEPAATRELFRRHRVRVHASLFRVLGTNRDMDDLLQEAFIQVFQSLRGWRAEVPGGQRMEHGGHRSAGQREQRDVARVDGGLVDPPAPGLRAIGNWHSLCFYFFQFTKRLFRPLARY